MSRACSYLSELLALGMGLIALLASTLSVLLSALRMLNAPCVIALAMLLSGSAVRLCSIFVKFGSSIVIVICHFCSFGFAPSASLGKLCAWCGLSVSPLRSYGQ